MEHMNMGDSDWRSSTRRLHGPGGDSSMGSVLGFGYGAETNENENESGNNGKCDKYESTEEKCEDSSKSQDNENNNNNQESSSQSDAEKVREFTYEAGQNTPDSPQIPMDIDEVKFIGKMILDEMLELFSTVMSPEQAKTELKSMIDCAKSIPKMNVSPNQQHKLIAEQADAFVDIWYYSLNAACKKGINCSKIFEIVHNANMAKRDPKTKKFLKRNDGKIIKPQGWKPPNIEKEILRQMQYGAWTNDDKMNNQQSQP